MYKLKGSFLFDRIRGVLHRRRLKREGERGVEEVGHRQYVGGFWDAIGRLQFEFLARHGLEPHHTFLDIACGSLRGGVHLIPYLYPHNYFGVDSEASLIEAGLRTELPPHFMEEKRPRFMVSEDFEFERLGATFDFALAHSLFTHLAPEAIELCLQRLKPHIAEGGSLYATFLECEQPRTNPRASHAHDQFKYTRAQMIAFGADLGWQARYLGDWGHPRGQIMVRYAPA